MAGSHQVKGNPSKKDKPLEVGTASPTSPGLRLQDRVLITARSAQAAPGHGLTDEAAPETF